MLAVVAVTDAEVIESLAFVVDLIKVPVRVSAGDAHQVNIQPRHSAVTSVPGPSSTRRLGARRRTGRLQADDRHLRAGGDRVHDGRRCDPHRRSAALSLRPAVPAGQGPPLSVADPLPGGVQRGDWRCRRQELEMGRAESNSN